MQYNIELCFSELVTDVRYIEMFRRQKQQGENYTKYIQYKTGLPCSHMYRSRKFDITKLVLSNILIEINVYLIVNSSKVLHVTMLLFFPVYFHGLSTVSTAIIHRLSY